MGETPDQIRDEIEQTRERMGDTVEAIGYKADVKAADQGVGQQRRRTPWSARSAAAETRSSARPTRWSRASAASFPTSQEVKDGAARVGLSKENPLGLAIAGAAADSSLGTLLPKTPVEDDTMGPVSDQVTDKVKEAGARSVRARQGGRPRSSRRRHGDRAGPRAIRSTADEQEPPGQSTGDRSFQLISGLGQGQPLPQARKVRRGSLRTSL